MKKTEIKRTILQPIVNDIKNISWTTKTVENKALNFTTKIFDLILNKYNTLDIYHPMANQFWTNGIEGKTDHVREIKKQLVDNNILEVKEGLWKDKRVLSYKFNSKYFNNFIDSDNLTFINVITKNIKQSDYITLENRTIEIMTTVKVSYNKEDILNIVDNKINKIKEVKDITETHIDITLEYKKYRYSASKAIRFTEENDYKLVSFNNNYYFVKDIEEFKTSKRNNLFLYYTKQLFDIENNINLYAHRNDTNNRLDTNFTNLKSELWEFVTLDNEKLVEIDIINAQFAILANIMRVDDNFYQLAITGKLYEYIAKELKCTRKEAKNKMFKVAFDKVRKDQDDLRKLFPKTMKQIDKYKKENGHKLFSNLLQKYESNLMISTILTKLLKEHNVLSVHDSIRCKQTDKPLILEIIKETFKEMNFKCKLSIKTDTEEIQDINTEVITISNINTLEVKEDVQTETKIDYILKKQIKDSITSKLTEMYNYQMVSNLQFRPILNKVIDDAYEIVVNGNKLNKTILKELIIKHK